MILIPNSWLMLKPPNNKRIDIWFMRKDKITG